MALPSPVTRRPTSSDEGRITANGDDPFFGFYMGEIDSHGLKATRLVYSESWVVSQKSQWWQQLGHSTSIAPDLRQNLPINQGEHSMARTGNNDVE